jgi:hypothetical protein
MADQISTEDAITALGGPLTSEPPVTDPPVTDPPATDPITDPVVTTDPPATDPPADDVPPAVVPDKSQQAFIHMRQQNTQLNNLIKGIGKLLEVPDTDLGDESKLTAALQAKILANEAKTSNIPVEVLSRLQTLEQRDQ